MWRRHSSRSKLPPRFKPADLPLRITFGQHQAILRWLRPDDDGRLLAFFESHSPETVYQRYGFARCEMTPEQAAQLVNVDQTRDAALGVFEETGRPVRLVAVGRYCLGADGRWAEVAFVVHEAWRGLGIGHALFAALRTIAVERGLERLVAVVQHDNTPMLAMARAAGAVIEPISGTSTVEATVTLARDTEPPSASGGHRRQAARSNWASTAACSATVRLERVSRVLLRMPLP